MEIQIRKVKVEDIKPIHKEIYCENCFGDLTDRKEVIVDDLGTIFCNENCAKRSEDFRQDIQIQQVDNEVYPICRCDECGKELSGFEINRIEENNTKGFQMCNNCLNNYKMVKEFLVEYTDRQGNIFMKDIKGLNVIDVQKIWLNTINKDNEFLLNSVSEY